MKAIALFLVWTDIYTLQGIFCSLESAGEFVAKNKFDYCSIETLLLEQ